MVAWWSSCQCLGRANSYQNGNRLQRFASCQALRGRLSTRPVNVHAIACRRHMYPIARMKSTRIPKAHMLTRSHAEPDATGGGLFGGVPAAAGGLAAAFAGAPAACWQDSRARFSGVWSSEGLRSISLTTARGRERGSGPSWFRASARVLGPAAACLASSEARRRQLPAFPELCRMPSWPQVDWPTEYDPSASDPQLRGWSRRLPAFGYGSEQAASSTGASPSFSGSEGRGGSESSRRACAQAPRKT